MRLGKDAATRNPHADPRILSARGKCWVDCPCGWVSGEFDSPALASRAWSLHVAAKGNR